MVTLPPPARIVPSHERTMGVGSMISASAVKVSVSGSPPVARWELSQPFYDASLSTMASI